LNFQYATGIAFHNVSFSDDRGFGIRNLSLDIAGGEFIGIVGPTGGGKSTLIDLLLRFYEPESGYIAIDGEDIRTLPLTDLRAQIALIPQDVFLWHATIRENIAYPDSSDDLKAVEEAAKLAEIHDFIQQQPKQYETPVGERGLALSGGERQRIAIARALMKQSRILLLDEATSALDALTEVKIRQAIDRARSGRTTLVIAHRLATVFHADRILVIQNRQLAEAGHPREILRRKGIFYHLYRAQALDVQEGGNT